MRVAAQVMAVMVHGLVMLLIVPRGMLTQNVILCRILMEGVLTIVSREMVIILWLQVNVPMPLSVVLLDRVPITPILQEQISRIHSMNQHPRSLRISPIMEV